MPTKMWSKVALKINPNQIGLMVGKKGAVLFGDIQSPAREEYMKLLEDQGTKITYPNTNFKVEFPPDEKKAFVRWTCPRIIHKTDTMDRKSFDMIVLKHIRSVEARILGNLDTNTIKYEKTFRIRASTERHRVGMFIGNSGENVNKLKSTIRETFHLEGRVWIDILEEGDDEIQYMCDYDDDTDDSAWFTIKFSYLKEQVINDAEIESIIEEFINHFDEDEDEELLDDDEMIGEW